MITSPQVQLSTTTFQWWGLHVQIDDMADEPEYSIELTIRNSEDIMEYLTVGISLTDIRNRLAND